jgi:HK97 family phage major capsid protein
MDELDTLRSEASALERVVQTLDAVPGVLAAAADDPVLDELCGAPETKAAGRPAPENKALRGPPASRRNFEADIQAAVVEIGKEMLKVGETVSDMKRRVGHTSAPTLAARKRTALDRLAEVKASISALEVKRNRPPGLGSRYPGAGSYRGARDPYVALYKQAVSNWMRTGAETFRGHHLSELQRKAGLFTELGPSGGYIVMPERGNLLDAMLTQVSVMRQQATVQQISTGEFVRPVNKRGTAGGWVSERQARPETDAPQLGEDHFPVSEIYAEPAATRALLDDAMIDVEAWLANEVIMKFAEDESTAFISGDGVGKPRGLLTYPFVTDHSTWEHGKFRLIETGVSGALPPTTFTGSPPTSPFDVLMDMIYAVKGGHRAACSWIMNSTTASLLRQIKSTTGEYIWREGRGGVVEGQPPSLLGYPVHTDEYMPDIGADTVPIGFGDWKRTYLILDRTGVRVVRDEVTQKPFILFYTTKRLGGGVQYFDAAVFLRCST